LRRNQSAKETGKGVFWGFLIEFFGALAWHKEVRKYHTIDESIRMMALSSSNTPRWA